MLQKWELSLGRDGALSMMMGSLHNPLFGETLTSPSLQVPTTPENIENIDWTRAQLRYSPRVSFIVIVMTMQKHRPRNISFIMHIINDSQSSIRQIFTHFRFDMRFMWWQVESQYFTHNFWSNRKKKSTRSNPQTPRNFVGQNLSKTGGLPLKKWGLNILRKSVSSSICKCYLPVGNSSWLVDIREILESKVAKSLLWKPALPAFNTRTINAFLL